MAEFCPTCGVNMSPTVHQRRTRYVITERGRAVLAEMKGEPMQKCKRCGAPMLPGFGSDDQSILCSPCELVLADEREPVR